MERDEAVREPIDPEREFKKLCPCVSDELSLALGEEDTRITKERAVAKPRGEKSYVSKLTQLEVERGASPEKESGLCLLITIRGSKEELSDQELTNPALHREPFNTTEATMSAHGKAPIEKESPLTPGGISGEEGDEE